MQRFSSASANSRHALTLALLVVAVALAGCAPVKRVNPPSASLQGMGLNAEHGIRLDLRLQNFSDVSTRFSAVNLKVSIAGIDAGTLTSKLDLDVAPHLAEVARLDLPFAEDQRQRLRTALSDATAHGGSFDYILKGTISTSEPAGEAPLDYHGKLSPVPGKPGEFR